MKFVKITKVTENAITFSNGKQITFDHQQDCCEYNYADFNTLDDLARAYRFQLPLQFEALNGVGFRFGDARRMFFVPCYSEQNGYYSTDIVIYYDGKKVLDFEAEFVDC